MEIRWDEEPRISDIKAHVGNGEIKLTFKWHNALENLYIYKQSRLQLEEIDWEKPYRKYTKEEYARFGGFIDQNQDAAISKYVLCPYVQRSEEGESYLITYQDHSNEIEVISHPITIRYEIREKKKLFSNRKLVQMQVFCELPMPKEYLCYVKKRGNIPVSLEDGMKFQFITDFKAGDNELPEIEVDKDEHVRIYLTEEVPYKEAYRIIKA